MIPIKKVWIPEKKNREIINNGMPFCTFSGKRIKPTNQYIPINIEKVEMTNPKNKIILNGV